MEGRMSFVALRKIQCYIESVVEYLEDAVRSLVSLFELGYTALVTAPPVRQIQKDPVPYRQGRGIRLALVMLDCLFHPTGP